MRLMKTEVLKRVLVLSALLLLGAGSASAQDVRYNFDKSASFANFKTYRWVTMKDAAKVSDLVDKQIKEVVDAELAKKGLTKSDSETADLYVGYQAGVQKEKEYTQFNSGWGYGPGWYGGGWYGGGGGMTTGSTSTIYIGQRALALYGSQAHNLVFRSVASKTIDTEAKPEKQQKNLKKAVEKMLKDYPPKEKK